MKYEKYLPVGTVVMLKGGTKRVVIIGFCSYAEDNKLYDYSGCLYPEGLLSANKILLFNHDQIESIYYMGFVDEEEVQFKQNLNSIVSKMTNFNSANTQ